MEKYIAPDRKRIPYGMMNFAVIRRDDCYYVDKTRFIPMIEEADKFFFFIRPRRFGKSLTVNMLQHYYDILAKDKFDALFGDLYIGKHPTRDRNSYLVLYLNFSGIVGELHNYRKGLDAHCQTMFDYFCDIYADYLPKGIKEELDKKEGAVEQFEYLFTECNKTNQRIYLFIDEYDHFTNAILSDIESLHRYTDETHGEVYGFSLVYSGNHSTVAKIDQFGNLRVQQGINPHQFEWILKPNESFCTPQSIICYSDSGIGAMTREYHDVFRNNLMRSKWVNKKRPILINNWEGTYFDFTEEKLLQMAEKAHKAGIELFVLDDGWFGKRNNDTCSLGDWKVNYDKLPSGIDGLAEKINKIGMKFGLWFEPEMISPDSDLYREHPDWAIHIDEREGVQSRNQMVLDLSRDEVCEYVINAVSDILANANIEYVKWDMNRQLTDMPRLGYNHEYTLGYYKIMSAITEKFPNILFEGCSAGGGRFDAGVLAYMPQIWTSDNSDAIARLKMQYSTSMCYPVYSISSHVTASPNHQCGRVTSLKTRADVAYCGTFGYELDVTKMSDEEFEEIKAQIKFEKRIQDLMCNGDLYRLINPYETNYCSWEVVSKDKKHIFVMACKVLAVAQTKSEKVKLQGLDTNKQYRNIFTGKVYSGDFLMYHGIRANYEMKDFSTVVFEFAEI